MAARQLAELISEEGKVALIGFMPGSASTMEREQGFEEEIKKHPKIQLVASVFGEASQAKAMRDTENIITHYPDLAGLFADNESSSLGAVRALKSRADAKVRMVAFDASESLIDDLRHRNIDALLVQDPFKMGYEATKAVAMKLTGQTPSPHIDSGITLVTRGDLEKPDVVNLLFPDIKRYLAAGK